MSILDAVSGGQHSQEKSHFKNLIAVAMADGHISHEEYDLLYIVGKKFGTTHEEVDEVIKNHKDITFDPPADKETRYIRLINLIRMMWADGEMDDKEKAVIKKFCIGLGFQEDVVARLVDKISGMVLRDMDDDEILEQLA